MTSKLTLVTGPDAFLARAAVQRIKFEYDPDGYNSTSIDARSANIDEIIAALSTPGFFGTTRVIVVRDLMSVTTKGLALDDDSSNRSANGVKSGADWPSIFRAIEPSNAAVFVDPDLSGIPAAVRRAMPSHASTFLGDPPRGLSLLSWMKDRAAENGSSMADVDARLLAEVLSPGGWSAKSSNPAFDRPPDLDLFANEIAKLALAAHPDAITRSLIVELTAVNQPDRLFPLVDAVTSAEGASAIRELSVATVGGEEIARIGAQLNQQLELMVALEAAERRDPIEVGKALGLANPNRMINVGKSIRDVRSRPSRLLGAAIETERKFKSGVLRQPADQVYALIERVLSLSRPTREGGT